MAEQEEKIEEKEEKTEEKDTVEEEVKKDISESKEEIKETKKEKKEDKGERPILEREYIVPLKRKVIKAARYRRAKKAIRVLKEFLAKHMKVEDRDLRKVKIDRYLNQEIWFRGIKNPPSKIKVKASKMADGTVIVKLVDIPDKVKYDMERDERNRLKVDKKALKQIAKKEEKEKKEKGEVKQDVKEEKEKEKSTIEAGFKNQELAAKQSKHTVKQKQPKQSQIQRKSLKK